MHRCVICGYDSVPTDARFCVSCGSELSPRRRRRWSALAVVTVLLIAGGLAAWALTGGFSPTPARPSAPDAAGPAGATTTAPALLPSTEPPPPPTPASGTASSSGATVDAREVLLAAEARTSPYAQPVQAGLTSYYDAINAHDYDAWQSTVQPEVSSSMPRSDWLLGYRSTHDDQIVVSSISSSGTDALATVSMRSNQAPQDGPEGMKVARVCWTLTLPVDSTTGTVGEVVPGSASKAEC